MPDIGTGKKPPYTRLKRTLESITNSLFGEDQAEIRAWSNTTTVKAVNEKLDMVQNVTTLFSQTQWVRLSDFYLPPTVKRFNAESESVEGRFSLHRTGCYADFDTAKCILIEGSVGHGKSILLRHLHHQELATGNTLPIFLELRKITNPDLFRDFLIDHLKSRLGLRCSEGLLDTLLKNSKISLFLDGFDEVALDLRQDLVHQLESIYAEAEGPIKLFITSRQKSQLRSSSAFTLYQLIDLDKEAQEQLIRKILKPEDQSVLIRNLREMKDELRSLLNTPLIVTLFALVYKRKVLIPDSYISFYKQLFETLVSIHDGMKRGFSRQSRSGMSSTEMQTALEYLAMLTKKNESTEFEASWFLEQCKRALEQSNINSSLAPKFLGDLLHNTCLIKLDGDHYCFLHDTIQFYFAASCVKHNASDLQKEQFYTARLKLWKRWEYELNFLSVLDKANFNRMYYIPEIKRLFKSEYFPNDLNFSREAIFEIIQSCALTSVQPEGLSSRLLVVVSPVSWDNYPSWVLDKLIQGGKASSDKIALGAPMLQTIENCLKSDRRAESRLKKLLDSKRPLRKEKTPPIKVSRLSEVIRALNIEDAMEQCLQSIDLSLVTKKYKDIQKIVETSENTTDLFE